MDENYIVVLFKNKLKKKIINKFKTSKRAESFFNKLLEKSDKVIFNKVWENAAPSHFEIAILEKKGKEEKIYKTDELGRNIKVELEDQDYQFKKIVDYRVEEKIFDLQKNKKITVGELLKKYFSGSGIKMVSTLNNKIIVQSNENYFIFSTKNMEESHRFIECLRTHFYNIKRGDVILVKDIDSSQRAYLYGVLCEKGYDKQMLYRRKTTYRPR